MNHLFNHLFIIDSFILKGIVIEYVEHLTFDVPKCSSVKGFAYGFGKILSWILWSFAIIRAFFKTRIV